MKHPELTHRAEGPSFKLRNDKMADALCKGTASPGICLFAAIAHPAEANLREAYRNFRAKVIEGFDQHGLSPDPHFLIYEAASLHATVATLIPFTQPPPVNGESSIAEWKRILGVAQASPSWPPRGSIRLVGSHLDANGAGYLVVEDTHGCMQNMRECLREAAALSSRPEAARLRCPAICHMTCFRWRNVEDAAISERTFKTLADCFERAWSFGSIEVLCSELTLVLETLQYMFDATIKDRLPLTSR